MPDHPHWPDTVGVGNAPRPSPRESALYTHDMLNSLMRMAEAQKQERLASLIRTAANEAKALASRE
jgi:hypothetical protein